MRILRALKIWWIRMRRSKEWRVWNCPPGLKCCARCATRTYSGMTPICGRTGLPCYPRDVCGEFK